VTIQFPKRVRTNTTDLELAIREGCQPMQRLFDSVHRLPYFQNIIQEDNSFNALNESLSLGHMPGRWLDALLAAEHAVGIRPDEAVIRRLADIAYMALDHPIGLPRNLDMTTYGPANASHSHNLRESMHAFAALLRHRGETRALDAAKRQIAAVSRYYDFAAAVWKTEQLLQETGGKLGGADWALPMHLGRYIGPLVKLYRASGLEEALEQAIRIKTLLFRCVFNEQGDYDPQRFGDHTHSTTSTLSSLALLGDTLGDKTIFDRIVAFMNNGLRHIALPFGWCLESNKRKDHCGEINNTGDILETCLILGKRGYPGYWQQAEQIMRSHLLPAQLLDTCFVPEWDRPEEDGRHRMASRAKGAFGFPCPYGHEYEPGSRISFNYDIVGGGVSSLCAAYLAKVDRCGSLIGVNLHFDHRDDEIEVTSPYPNGDTLELYLKKAHPVRVRLSDWVDRERVAAKSRERDDIRTVVLGEWLYLFGLQAGDSATIRLPMAVRTVSYPFRGDTFTFRWRGDAVEAAASAGKRLTFFDELE